MTDSQCRGRTTQAHSFWRSKAGLELAQAWNTIYVHVVWEVREEQPPFLTCVGCEVVQEAGQWVEVVMRGNLLAWGCD